MITPNKLIVSVGCFKLEKFIIKTKHTKNANQLINSANAVVSSNAIEYLHQDIIVSVTAAKIISPTETEVHLMHEINENQNQ